ncbi:PadR family transcriptional regulator [Kineococcus halophytocola]|uniref:PadR family transcriptional regulator n=1 Tax=Kineococcus halophytocola TaxID=3234027 RepID=UPI003519F03D
MNTLDWYLLSMLARRPSSGYDLRGAVVHGGQFVGIRASMTSIYRSLTKLEEAGYLEWETSERDNAPDAKVYRLTVAGREELLRWARAPHEPSPRPMDPDFVVKFAHAGQFGRDIALDVARRELQYRRQQKQVEGETGASAGELDPIPELDPAWVRRIQFLSHARGYASTAAYIAWLELTVAELEAELETGTGTGIETGDPARNVHGDVHGDVPAPRTTT